MRVRLTNEIMKMNNIFFKTVRQVEVDTEFWNKCFIMYFLVCVKDLSKNANADALASPVVKLPTACLTQWVHYNPAWGESVSPFLVA